MQETGHLGSRVRRPAISNKCLSSVTCRYLKEHSCASMVGIRTRLRTSQSDTARHATEVQTATVRIRYTLLIALSYCLFRHDSPSVEVSSHTSSKSYTSLSMQSKNFAIFSADRDSSLVGGGGFLSKRRRSRMPIFTQRTFPYVRFFIFPPTRLPTLPSPLRCKSRSSRRKQRKACWVWCTR